MITIKRTIEFTCCLEESALKAFADRNGYDINELNEAIDNDDDDLDLDEEWGDDGNLESGFDPYEGCYTYDC